MANKFSEKNMAENSLRSKAKGLENRLKELEETIGRLVVGIDKRLNEIGVTFQQNAEVVEAIIEHIGAEAVNDVVMQKRQERAQKQTEAEVKALSEAIQEGYVTDADVIGENSFIVGFEVDGNRALVGTGRQQVAFKSLKPEFKELLLGKTVGEVIKTPTGGTFEVREVYTLDEEKYQAAMQAKAAQASAAAGEAATQDENK